MKVMHLEAGKHLYGGAKQVTYLLRELSKMGVENVLVCPKDSEISVRCDPSVKVHTLSMRGEMDILFLWKLIALFRRDRPDLLHVHSRRGADIWGPLAAKVEGIPVICSRRVDNKEPKWLAKWKYRQFAKVITISEAIRKQMLTEGVPGEKLQKILSVVDIEEYCPSDDRRAFLKEFGLTEENLVVANFAQLIERKGQLQLIQAIQTLLPRFPQLKLFLFGKGADQGKLENYVREKKLHNVVKFWGFRHDASQIMPHVDLVAHPAKSEGLGVALLQASACGVPIVATHVGGIPEVIENGVTGLLIPPHSVLYLASAMSTILTLKKEQRKQMGLAGRKRVENLFSPFAMAKGNYEVYQEVLVV